MTPKPSPQFLRSLRLQDKRDLPSIFRDLERLRGSRKPLGKKLRDDLSSCRSIRTGAFGQLRIVYFENEDLRVLLQVGPRDGLSVYANSQKVLRELGL